MFKAVSTVTRGSSVFLMLSGLLITAFAMDSNAATGDVSLNPAASQEVPGATFTREVLVDVGTDVLSNRYATVSTISGVIRYCGATPSAIHTSAPT